MTNDNITLLPLDGFVMPEEKKEETITKTPTLDLTSPSYAEPEVKEEAREKAPEAKKDTRSKKEKLLAAIKREREVFDENKIYNKDAAKRWSDEKKAGAKALLEGGKERIKAVPERAKRLFSDLPEKVKGAVQGLPKKIEEIKKDKSFPKRAIVSVLLGIWALIVLFPFYYMLITSFKDYPSYSAETDILSKIFVKAPTLESYAFALNAVSLGKYFMNTLIFTIATTAIMLIVTVLASYGFARINFKGKNLVFTAFLSMMMIPAELVVITNFITITNLDLRNSFMGLILPSITSVFYIYLLKENFQQVPNELYYAAKVDGTADLKYLFKVMIPICQPTIVTVTILKVIECWNSYVWPRLITDDEEYYLVSNGIQAIRESGFGRDNVPAMMSAVVIVSIPLILLFLIFRNKIMEGVARGGTKG